MGWKLQQPPSVVSSSRYPLFDFVNSSITIERSFLFDFSGAATRRLLIPGGQAPIAHHTSCSCVDGIRVVWSSTVAPSEDFLRSVALSKSRSDRNPRVDFNVNFKGDFMSRFRPIGNLRMDAVLSVDDDTIVPCSSLEFGFAVWQTAPTNMKNGDPYYGYEGWWTVWWKGTDSFVLAEAAFFHRKYLDMFASGMPSAIYEYLGRERVCKDIAMSLLIANATSSPPIWVKGKTYKIGSSRISVETGQRWQE